MGVVQIPSNQTSSGTCKAHLDLDSEELRKSIELLKEVIGSYGVLAASNQLAGLSLHSLPGALERAHAHAHAPMGPHTPSGLASLVPQAQAPNAGQFAVPVPMPMPTPSPIPSTSASYQAVSRMEQPAAPAASKMPMPIHMPVPQSVTSGPRVSAAPAPPAVPVPQPTPAAVPAPIPMPRPAPQAVPVPMSRPSPTVPVPMARPPPAVPVPAPMAIPQPQPSYVQAFTPSNAPAQGYTSGPGPRAAVPPAVPPPAPPSSSALPQWECCHTTDASDHNRNPVLALQYSPFFEGLPGGDGHGGWLVSSSKQLLVLWQCNLGGGRGEISLMPMHFQDTEYVTSHMAIEPALNIMYGVSGDTRSLQESVTVHSMSADAGMLAIKYKMPLPAAPQPQQRQPGQPPLRMGTKVASLHALGGGLRHCSATAYGTKVIIHESPGLVMSATGGAALVRPKAEWVAQEAGVSALAAGHMGAMLATGGKDGAVTIWDMRSRPPGVSKRMSHRALVSCVQLLDETTCVSGSHDGRVCLWDIRSPAQPRFAVAPDGGAVRALKASPIGDCIAVATQKGLFSLDLLDGRGAVAAVLSGPPKPMPFLDVEWNMATNELYACNADGSISVYRQKQ